MSNNLVCCSESAVRHQAPCGLLYPMYPPGRDILFSHHLASCQRGRRGHVCGYFRMEGHSDLRRQWNMPWHDWRICAGEDEVGEAPQSLGAADAADKQCLRGGNGDVAIWPYWATASNSQRSTGHSPRCSPLNHHRHRHRSRHTWLCAKRIL